MAISQNPYVHLETMEETEDKDKKSAKDGSTKGLGMASRKQSQRILVCDSYDSGQFSNDKRNSGFYDLATAYQSVHVNY